MGVVVERRRSEGFTLIELLVVATLVAIVLAVGVPNFRDFIILNRLKAVNAQLVTDLQFARAEAAARNMPVWWTMRVTGSPPTLTCYALYTTTVPGLKCNCALGPGNACGTDPRRTEIRVTQVPSSGIVSIGIGDQDTFAFDNVSGGIYYGTTDFSSATLTDFLIKTAVSTDPSKALHTLVSPAGRSTVCSAGSTLIRGYPACP